MGAYLLQGLQDLAADYPDLIVTVRGQGLLQAIEFQHNQLGYQFSKGMFDAGILVAGTLINAKTVRIEPPLTFTEPLIDRLLTTADTVLKGIREKQHSGINQTVAA